MKTKHFYLLALMLFLFISCSEETTHSRTSFPDIRVGEYQFSSELGYIFYPETPFGVRIDDFSENKNYSYTDIIFQGWADAKEIKLSDDNIRSDIQEYLYNKYPDIIENPIADFIQEELQNIKIYANKDFNSIRAGESLNQFFEVSSRLIIHENNKYIVFDGDILTQKSFKNTFVPLDIKIKLKSPPQEAGKYDFFIEVKTDKGMYATKIISVSLSGK